MTALFTDYIVLILLVCAGQLCWRGGTRHVLGSIQMC